MFKCMWQAFISPSFSGHAKVAIHNGTVSLSQNNGQTSSFRFVFVHWQDTTQVESVLQLPMLVPFAISASGAGK